MSSRPQRKRDKKDNTDSAVDDLGPTAETDSTPVGANIHAEADTPPDNSVILSAINGLKGEFRSQYKEVLAVIKEVKEDFITFTERLTEAESRINQAEDNISGLQGRVVKLEKSASDLASALDMAECRSRRSNIRILGLPNGIEGNNPVSFLESWLPQLLGADIFPAPVIIERAHRLPSSGKQAGGNASSRPKTMILKLLNYADKDRILRAARARGTVMFQDHHIMFFPDLSSEVLKQRKRFEEVKIELRKRKIKYGMIFPAKLMVIFRDHRHFFDSPEEAGKFIATLPKDVREAEQPTSE